MEERDFDVIVVGAGCCAGALSAAISGFNPDAAAAAAAAAQHE